MIESFKDKCIALAEYLIQWPCAERSDHAAATRRTVAAETTARLIEL